MELNVTRQQKKLTTMFSAVHQPDQAEEEVEVSESDIAPREQMQVRGTKTFLGF